MIQKLKDLEQEAMDELDPEAYNNVKDLLLTQSGISESPSVYGAYDINIQGMDSKNILFLIDDKQLLGNFIIGFHWIKFQQIILKKLK